MKTTDYRQKDVKELRLLLEEMKGKLNRIYFDAAEKKLKDASQFKKTKKEIARIMTALKNNPTR